MQDCERCGGDDGFANGICVRCGYVALSPGWRPVATDEPPAPRRFSYTAADTTGDPDW